MVTLLKSKHHRFLLLSGLIILLATALRFYKTTGLFVFTGDEEHQLSMAQTIVNHFHLVWIGVSASNTGFYMGPFWVYFSAIWLYLSKGAPLIVSYIAAGLGVLTTLLVLIAGKQMFNVKVGLIAGFLYASLPLIVFYDKKFWNPSLTSFISVALLFVLYKTKDNFKWWYLVALLYGLVFHVHLSLVPYGLLIIYLFFKRKIFMSKKTVLFSLSIFLIVVSPLIIFDYFHKGSNLTTPLRVKEHIANNADNIDPLDRINHLSQSLGRLWYLYPFRSNSDEVLHACSPYYSNNVQHIPGITTTTTSAPLFLSLISFFLFIWFVVRRTTWKTENTKLLAVTSLIILAAYIFLPVVPLEYYLLGIFPLLLFITAIFYQNLSKIPSYLCLTLLMISAFLGVVTVLTSTEEYGTANKIELIKKVNYSIDNAPFELKETGLCHGGEGWRMLFKYYGTMPSRSSSDGSLGWLYPTEIDNGPVTYTVIMSESRITPKFNISNARIIEYGGFKAFLFKKE